MKLSSHSSQSITKMLAIGNSGSGKTGALASLVEAGYELAILDYDNGLDILRNVLEEKDRSVVGSVASSSPSLLDSVEFETLIERRKMVAGQLVLDGAPSVLPRTLKLLNDWPGLGPISSWPESRILVLDSLTFLAKAAFEWVDFTFHYKDPRQTYGETQKRIENLLGLLYSPSVPCNVYVASHIMFVDISEGVVKGYPTAVGRALSPQIPRYFNTVVEFRVQGAGPTAKRVIATRPTGLIDLKTSTLPTGIPGELPIETGLATLFRVLQGGKK